MKTLADVLSFARASADAALGNWRDYDSLEDAIDSGRENIRETLKEYRLVELEGEAWTEFDAGITRLRATA